jgi:roadblock/LC7 domain-containing protein
VSDPRPSGSFPGPRRIPSAMDSEFGRVLENLMDVPGSMGAVLVDDDGYAIDYVHDPAELAELEVQLIGAQLEQVVARTTHSAVKHDLGTPVVVLEGDRATVITGLVGMIYVLVFVLRCEADVPQGLHHFEAVRSSLDQLLT